MPRPFKRGGGVREVATPNVYSNENKVAFDRIESRARVGRSAVSAVASLARTYTGIKRAQASQDREQIKTAVKVSDLLLDKTFRENPGGTVQNPEFVPETLEGVYDYAKDKGYKFNRTQQTDNAVRLHIQQRWGQFTAGEFGKVVQEPTLDPERRDYLWKTVKSKDFTKEQFEVLSSYNFYRSVDNRYGGKVDPEKFAASLSQQGISGETAQKMMNMELAKSTLAGLEGRGISPLVRYRDAGIFNQQELLELQAHQIKVVKEGAAYQAAKNQSDEINSEAMLNHQTKVIQKILENKSPPDRVKALQALRAGTNYTHNDTRKFNSLKDSSLAAAQKEIAGRNISEYMSGQLKATDLRQKIRTQKRKGEISESQAADLLAMTEIPSAVIQSVAKDTQQLGEAFKGMPKSQYWGTTAISEAESSHISISAMGNYNQVVEELMKRPEINRRADAAKTIATQPRILSVYTLLSEVDVEGVLSNADKVQLASGVGATGEQDQLMWKWDKNFRKYVNNIDKKSYKEMTELESRAKYRGLIKAEFPDVFNRIEEAKKLTNPPPEGRGPASAEIPNYFENEEEFNEVMELYDYIQTLQ